MTNTEMENGSLGVKGDVMIWQVLSLRCQNVAQESKLWKNVGHLFPCVLNAHPSPDVMIWQVLSLRCQNVAQESKSWKNVGHLFPCVLNAHPSPSYYIGFLLKLWRGFYIVFLLSFCSFSLTYNSCHLKWLKEISLTYNYGQLKWLKEMFLLNVV